MTDKRYGGGLAKVASVNVGNVRTVTLDGHPVRTAIWKSPIEGSVRLRGVNLDGDDQADRSVHGGPDKAVYAYAAEDLHWWSSARGHNVGPGTFGENLTTLGIDLAAAVIGERWTVGSTVLEVSQPRIPCYKLGIRMGDDEFPRRFEDAGRMGAYLRIINEGVVAPGDVIEVISRPEHGVTLRSMKDALGNPEQLRALLRAPELPPYWWQLAERA